MRAMLTKAERDLLLPPIYRHSHGAYSAADEATLRRVIAKEYPDQARRMDREALMGLAEVIIGVAYYFGEPERAGA